MDGLGRAIGAGVPIQFNGEDLILDGCTIADFGLIEQHLLSKMPNPMDLARAQTVEFLRSAAALAPGIVVRRQRLTTLQAVEKPNENERAEIAALTESLASDDDLRTQLISMGEKVMSDGRAQAMRHNKIPAKEVAAWLDTAEGLTFTIWLKLGQRYPNRFSLSDTAKIMQTMHEADRDRLRKLRDQASGFDSLGNSIGPTSTPTMEAGPIGG